MALRPEHLNILSICTGGGGLDLGVELAIQGARTVCMVEREAFAVSSLVSAMEQGVLHPAPVWSDARTFDGRAWRGAVDGLIGGIPCQPHSLAGKRLGEDDERDLWSTARRIIVQSGVWFVLIENVRGMLSSGGAERVWRDLRRLGFQVEGGLFTAAEVGASHERERFFILAVAELLADGSGDRLFRRAQSNGLAVQSRQQTSRRRDTERRDRVVGYPDAGSSEVREGDETVCGRRPEQSASDRAAGGDVDEHLMGNTIGSRHVRRSHDPLGRSIQRASAQGAVGCPLFPPRPDDLSSWASVITSSPELEPAFRRVADGLASRLDIGRVDRLRMLGNGVVPLEAAYAVRTLATRLAARGSAGAARLVRMMELEGIDA
ncbi:DNA cytosine methyltransferase [Rhizobium mongolense]